MRLWRSTYGYRAHKRDDSALRKRILALAEQRRRFGQPRIYEWLRFRENWPDNHKRVERIYREEGLSLRRKKRRKRGAMVRVPMPAPSRPNEHWSMDFVMEALATGRRIRILNVVDDFTRECLAAEADTSLNGLRVTRVLDRLIERRGKPEGITVDNGPEFAGRTLDEWAWRNKVKLDFIRPGKPVENAYVESFNGRFRDECLNDNVFVSLTDAQSIIEIWRQDYNGVRLHGSLGHLTPNQFAEQEIKKIERQSNERLTLGLVQ